MPYIKEEQRKQYDEEIDSLAEKLETASVGEINYVISKLIWKLWNSNPTYTLGNNLVGVLECVKIEFYRRMLTPYEELKIKENGDLPLR